MRERWARWVKGLAAAAIFGSCVHHSRKTGEQTTVSVDGSPDGGIDQVAHASDAGLLDSAGDSKSADADLEAEWAQAALAAEEAENPTAQDGSDAADAGTETGYSAATDGHTPAMRYGNLGPAACLAEVAKRKLPIKRVDTARGTVTPLRLVGPLHGVSIHSAERPSARATSVFEIIECRLLLALDDWSKALAERDIVEVVHMSVYRPPPKGFPAGKEGTRHGGALAIDVGSLVMKDGTKIAVERDFHGGIGQKPCGPRGPPPQSTTEGKVLRELTCRTIAARFFHVVLTPGFNWAHRNHLHLEVSAKGRGYYVK
jgi:Extensin-like protein C-terminus